MNQIIFKENLTSHQTLFSSAEYEFIQGTLCDFPEIVNAVSNWEALGVNDERKKKIVSSLFSFHKQYPGGLSQYVATGKALLEDALNQKNTLNDIQKISIPECDDLDNLSPSLEKSYQEIAIENFDKLAISLVAGGIGERLGLNIEKINIPFDSYQGKTYLQWYCELIVSMQKLYHDKTRQTTAIPLVIMVSEKTIDGIKKALSENKNFGLKNEQIFVEQQLMSPCFKSFSGEIAIDNKYEISTKPHGHGDIHILMYKSVLEKLSQSKKEFLFFIQDTNIQIINLISTGLGFCIDKKKDFSFFAIKKEPNEQVGSIANVLTKDNETHTCNIEYNQVAVLKDENFKKEEFQYPANTNILFTRISTYTKVLQERKGQLFEFINPKITEENGEKKLLKFPRLETMMQDISKYYPKDSKIGVAFVNKDKCFSPLKTNLKDYLEKFQLAKNKQSTDTIMKSTLVFSENLYFEENKKKLSKNNFFKEATSSDKVGNIQIPNIAKILLHPLYHLSDSYAEKNVLHNKFGVNSVVILDGDIHLENVTIEDNASLVIKAGVGVRCVLKNLTIKNKGYLKKEIKNDFLRAYDYELDTALVVDIQDPGVYQINYDLSYERLERLKD